MFIKSQIIKAEITKDAQNKITKIYLVSQIQDDAIVGIKDFDYVIDGGTLDEIRSNLKDGIQNLLKEQIRIKHQEWLEEAKKSVEIKQELTPLQIKTQIGFDEITQL